MKNQKFRIQIIDRRAGGESEHVEEYDDLKDFLRRAQQLAGRRDAHVAERTTAKFYLYPKKTVPGLFE